MEHLIETYLVDSFTDEIFKGNPAGVCLLENDLDDNKMLSIAKELGLSETAFIRTSDISNAYFIRYFSPKMEIPLCGHATLASAKVLFKKYAELNDIHFITTQNIDLLIVRDGKMIKMDFPVYQTFPATATADLLNALGIQNIINSEYNEETNILLLEIDDNHVLEHLQPNFEALYQSHKSINGVLVTAKSKRTGYDFESRYFWPWSGTNEDPVTGGTHTFLAKYWGDKLNKTKMKSFQCSERTGFMEVELIGNNMVALKGEAQIVLEGKMRV